MSFRKDPRGDFNISGQPSTSDPVNDAEFSEDYELIEEMEWGPRRGEDGYDTDQELAPRPSKSAASEKCGCIPPLTGMGCNDDSCILFACREECRSNCDLGHLCGNKRLTKKIFAEIDIFDADRKGKGLRLRKTTAAAKKGDLLCEYLGRAIREGALNRLFRRYQFDRRLYILSLGNGIYVDARKKGGVARYINHSCNPNCKVELWKVKGIMRAAVVALRDIQPGEEICFDYQWERKRGRAPTVCHCGEDNCRGTLEVLKSQAEAKIEEELKGHWERFNAPPDQTIVNRTIRLFSDEHKEYFMGDVTGYDAQRGLHCVLYHQDMNEMWEDLAKEDWMVLDETVDENFMIAKKVQRRKNSERPSLLEKAQLSLSRHRKNFRFVQLPVKEALLSQGIIDRCQRNFNVLVDVQEFGRPPLPPNMDDPEDVEKYKALDSSNESTVWKLSIRGANVTDAFDFLERTIGGIVKRLANASDDGQTAQGNAIETYKQEMIFPRAIADGVKRNIQSVKERCQNVTITFIASESRSKRFCRVTLDAVAADDNEKAMELLWTMCVDLCVEAKTERTTNGVFRDLGFLGCLLSAEEFNLLAASNTRGESEDCTLNGSAFICSFERIFNCSVWVQDPDDQGRINSQSRLVGGMTRSSPRKVFFGCEPHDLSRLASTIRDRVKDLSRGVQYLHLGADQGFVKLMMDHKFFEFVSSITGTSVSIDPVTGDHLRIDGRSLVNVPSVGSTMTMSERSRAALADEILRLQVQCYVLECVRQQSWLFGRDWSLAFNRKPTSNGTEIAVGVLTEQNARQCCLDIAEIVDRLELPSCVAGHAAVVLYRFTISEQATTLALKTREGTLAVCNIANKSQKASKWKPLLQILEAGYGVVYPGAEFNSNSEETQVLQDRVAVAERHIFASLQFDIFWESIVFVRLVATGRGKMKPAFVDDIFKLVFSGQFLSGGAELWLRFGIRYIFAVAAFILKADLRIVVTALSLIPNKLSEAASLLMQTSSFCKSKNYAHPVLGNGKGYFEAQAAKIEKACLSMANEPTVPDLLLSSEERRYQQICKDAREIRVLSNISRNHAKQLMPIVEATETETSCCIRMRLSTVNADTIELLLDGDWRANACAEYLILSKIPDISKRKRDYVSPGEHKAPNEKAKIQPGVVDSNGILVSDGWQGTIQTDLTPFKTSGRFGGKCCMPSSVKESYLRSGGLSWWIPKSGTCVSGSIIDLVGVASDDPIKTIASVAKSIAVDPSSFPTLSGLVKDPSADERCMAISIQRWPSKKVEDKEAATFKHHLVGVSAAALQEMQLLKELHCLVPTPRGHPNFVLPIGIAKADAELSGSVDKPEAGEPESIFSILKSSDENNKNAERKRRIEGCEHLMFEPSPFVLQRFLSRKHWPDHLSVTKTVVSAWFHDCISILVHCHSNHILLRSIGGDNIIINQCGVLKLGGLYRSTVLSDKDMRKKKDPIEAAREAFKLKKGDKKPHRKRKRTGRKGKTENGRNGDEQHFDVNTAPEILLGKASDVWSMGFILAGILTGKPLWSGHDREGLLQSLYKVVGTPSKQKGHFESAIRSPYYKKPEKSYGNHLDRVLAQRVGEEFKHEMALVCRMLCLDPDERITAEEALSHEAITEYLKVRETDLFKDDFAKDWLHLKKSVIKKVAEDDFRKNQVALAMAPSLVASKDDLYAIDDLLDTKYASNKKTKLQTS